MIVMFIFFVSNDQVEKNPDESSIIETLKKELPSGVATFDLRTTLQKFSMTSKVDVSLLGLK